MQTTPTEADSLSASPRTMRDLLMPAFAEWARITPDRLAVSAGDEMITYSQLDLSSRVLAGRLTITTDVGEGSADRGLVGFVGTVGLDCVIALMAAHRAALGFVFLDADLPLHALEQLARHAQVVQLVAARPTVQLSLELGHALDMPILMIGEIWPPAAIETTNSLANREQDYLADHRLSHIRYTSGSTGQPKGVPISRASLCWALKRLNPTIETRPEDRFGLFGHFWPLIVFEALVGGASLHAFDPARLGPGGLANQIQSESISVMATYAALFSQVVNLPGVNFPSLRLAHISGESLRSEQVLRFERACPNAELVNSYGSSEFPLIACYRHKRGSLSTKDAVPAGLPFRKTEVVIVDETHESLPSGEIGEIVIESPYVPSGYHRNDEQSAQTFLPLPDGRHRYLTGDLGYFDSSGCLFLAGRADDQIKIGGNAVRPAHIEQLILQFEEVSQCVVLATGQTPDGQRLACHYVATSGQSDLSLLPQELQMRLRRQLPRYMVPSYFVEHADLPRTATGKPDRASIKGGLLPGVGTISAADLDPDEQLVLKAWHQVLGHSGFDRQIEFQDAGATSLDMMTMLTRLEKLTAIRLPFEKLWQEGASISAIAEQLRRVRRSGLASTLVPISAVSISDLPNSPRHLLFAAHLLEGDLSDYFDLARHLGTTHPVLGFYPTGMDGLAVPGISMDALASHGRDLLQRAYPTGPYKLIGFSFGAVVAFELAQAISKSGETVDQLILIDPPVEWSDPLLHARLGWRALKSGNWENVFSFVAGRLNPRRTVHDAQLSALANFKPTPLSSVATLLVLSADDPNQALRRRLWQPLLQGAQTMVVAGDHHGMMRDPHAAILATNIQNWLNGQEPSTAN